MTKLNLSINPNHMFSGNLAFLSNMYPCEVRMNIKGQWYTFQNSEAAFQAGKCRDKRDIKPLTAMDGKTAKHYGRKVFMRKDWGIYRVTWMQRVVLSKFRQNPDLMEQLLATHPLPLKETNYWHDTFWGICDGKGENHLGRILMEIREANRPFIEEQKPLDVVEVQNGIIMRNRK